MGPLPDLGEGAEPKAEFMANFRLEVDRNTLHDAVVVAALQGCAVDDLVVAALREAPTAARWIAGLSPRVENPITLSFRVPRPEYNDASEAVKQTGRGASVGSVCAALLHQNISGAIHAAGEDGILVSNFFAELRHEIKRVNDGHVRAEDLERRFSVDAVERYNDALGPMLQDRHLIRGRIGGYIERTGPAPESGNDVTARILAERNRESEADARNALRLIGA